MAEPKTLPIEVLKFSIEQFSAALHNEYCSAEEVQRLRNINIFYGYLKDIDVKIIVVEKEYIDGDYMDDVSNYYVKCFKPYGRICKRLHFFSEEFTQEQVLAIVLGEACADLVEKFTGNYKGFIVARPLPVAIIGRTLLATYADDNGRRHYPCIRENLVHFFGIDLTVKSLEYQEQDTILAACATVALWTSLHKTHHMFQTPIRTPATITRQANEVVFSSRPIPSHGLIVQQINNAILRNDLVAEIIHISPETPLIPLLYGYIEFGLPVILGVEIGGNRGMHAISLLGYSLMPKKITFSDYRSSEIPFRANRINEFYAHDDQIVPFSRIVKQQPNKREQVCFDGAWIDENNNKLKMTPLVVIIPIYHKIRIEFSDVYKWLYPMKEIRPICQELLKISDSRAITGLQELLDRKVLNKLSRILNPRNIEWDLYLTTTTALKSDIRKNLPTQSRDLQEILLKSHPRFIWRALLIDRNGKVLLELLADATDIPRTLPFYSIIWRDNDLQRWLFQLIDNAYIRNLLENVLTRTFVNFLRSQ